MMHYSPHPLFPPVVARGAVKARDEERHVLPHAASYDVGHGFRQDDFSEEERHPIRRIIRPLNPSAVPRWFRGTSGVNSS